ncbi:sigma-54-dependent Fis family transcriptional regulator [Desulfobulbus sp. AH-315-M07]|nr:sigma-54-dependent Fis family transcriptional regulator [Desulfobulbus sp. AH-315-M07]
MKATILIVDDDVLARRALVRDLRGAAYDVEFADSVSDALHVLSEWAIDLVLVDLDMADGDGVSVLPAMRAAGQDQPVVMLSDQATITAAVEATELGACDFLTKPTTKERLFITITNALRMAHLAKQLEDSIPSFDDNLVGPSSAMEDLRSLIARAGPTEGRVLITGENGTGKGLVARAIHAASRRAFEDFVELNCAAIPTELVESELFGHEKGAFSGATQTRRGRFEQADGGTLFLDEVGDMPLAAQAKILRVLQERQLERVGGSRTIAVDVRVIAATNHNLQKMIEHGGFRPDLYHRLNVIPITTPPLRHRREDIPALANLFVSDAAARNRQARLPISADAIASLCRYDYPGNVRELQNIIERLVILTTGSEINSCDVDAVIGPRSPRQTTPPSLYRPGVPYHELIQNAQRDIVRAALEQNSYSVADAARALCLGRSHLYKKCHALGLTDHLGGTRAREGNDSQD